MPNRSKLTERRRQRVLAILSAGGSRREAARVAGIDPATLRFWLQRGERSTPGSRRRQFYEESWPPKLGSDWWVFLRR
jgi:transposase-like protein